MHFQLFLKNLLQIKYNKVCKIYTLNHLNIYVKIKIECLVTKRMNEDNAIIDLKLVAHIGEIQLIIVTEIEDLAHMLITKLESCISLKKSDIQIDAKLQNISVSDPSSDTIYKHVSIEK